MTRSPASTLQRSIAPSAPIGQRLALLWLAVALLFQGFATQTHAHLAGDGLRSASAQTRVAATATDSQKNDPAAPVCPLCEEKALFGAYLLAGSATIEVPVAATYRYAAATLPLLAPRISSHAWRSRAPPIATT